MLQKYDIDFCLWLKEQAEFLRKREFDKLDIENLVEEVDSIVIKEIDRIEEYLKTLILDRLRACNHTQPKGCIYTDSLFIADFMIRGALKNSPSLSEQVPEALSYAYAVTRLQFLDENDMDLNALPEDCPWNIEDFIKDDE